jgi:hypothetical protein
MKKVLLAITALAAFALTAQAQTPNSPVNSMMRTDTGKKVKMQKTMRRRFLLQIFRGLTGTTAKAQNYWITPILPAILPLI